MYHTFKNSLFSTPAINLEGMNLFVVPSWYPNPSNPTYGVFIKEQIAMMSRLRPNWKIGLSKWGQGDSEKLLWAKNHFKNIRKILKHNQDQSHSSQEDGFSEFYQPALSWTKKFRKGNLREIVRCNELNFQSHSIKFGTPDFITVQACYPGALIAKYLSDKYRIPFHIHIRLGGFMFERLLDDLGSMKKDLLNALQSADIVSVTSEFQKKSLKGWIKDAQVIHNPVDTEFFQPDQEKNKIFALTISRLEPEKGMDLLLEGLLSVTGIQLKIVGEGSLQRPIQRWIEEKGLSERVEIVGSKNRDEIRNLLQATQFLILPSRFETFGNVLLEAMACGRPVVATKCGGPKEIISEKVGFLSEVNTKDLSDKIFIMKEQFKSFDPFEIREYVKERHAPEVWMGQYEALLKDRL